MTVARRLAAVEAALTPTQRILLWLDEAHAFGSLEGYVRSLLDAPATNYPLNRLLKAAADSARTATRGQSRLETDNAIRQSLRETAFRFDLVFRVNVVAHEALDREALIYGMFTAQLALLASEDRTTRRVDEEHLERLATLRDTMCH